MNKETYQWQFRNGTNTPLEFTTFPFAFRAMYNIVRQGIEDGKPVDTSGFLIVGPKNPRGERVKYGYFAALELAQSFGLVNNEGYINGKEFKKKF